MDLLIRLLFYGIGITMIVVGFIGFICEEDVIQKYAVLTMTGGFFAIAYAHTDGKEDADGEL